MYIYIKRERERERESIGAHQKHFMFPMPEPLDLVGVKSRQGVCEVLTNASCHGVEPAWSRTVSGGKWVPLYKRLV